MVLRVSYQTADATALPWCSQRPTLQPGPWVQQPLTDPSYLLDIIEAVLANHCRAMKFGFVFLSGYITGVCNAVKEAHKGPVFKRLSSGFY